VFVFGKNSGEDVITDFSVREDKLLQVIKAEGEQKKVNFTGTANYDQAVQNALSETITVPYPKVKLWEELESFEFESLFESLWEELESFVFGSPIRTQKRIDYTLNFAPGNSVKLKNFNSKVIKSTIFLGAWLEGGAGDDILIGGSQSDTLIGGKGNDKLEGGAGNDRLSGGSGKDVFVFGKNSGKDVITDFSTVDDKLIRFIKAEGEDAKANFSGTADYDQVVENARQNGSSILNFADGDSVELQSFNPNQLTAKIFRGAWLEGGSGNDTLTGGSQNDMLIGGAGNDRLEGGKGKDVLTGGIGNDVFIYGKGDGHDIITDFSCGQDKLQFTPEEGSFAELMKKAAQKGNDVVITFDEENSVILQNVQYSSLTTDSFLF
jgi:Ca2+-binding RTX toxin-like protein